MFTKRIHLFSLLGFRVGLDLSWFLLALLIVWTLAVGYFPQAVEGLSQASYLSMGIAGAVGIFFSIIFHEFAHAMVARRYDMPISGITLFIFGGVAELKDEPPGPGAEFWVAIAGPISSYILAAVFYVLVVMVGSALGSGPITAVLGYLALINIVLATFNLIPAFPLDGGRVLRAGVWKWTGDLGKATGIAANMGRILGWVLIAFGVANAVTGNSVGGIWQVLIGFFIVSAAGMSEMQMEMKLGLAGMRAQDLMTSDVAVIPHDLTLADAVNSFFYRHYHKAFPVVRDGRAVGWLRLEDVGEFSNDLWPTTAAIDAIDPKTADHVIRRSAPMREGLEKMREHNTGRLMVVDAEGAVEGVLTQRDIMDFLAIRGQLNPRSGAGPLPRRERTDKPERAVQASG